MRRPFKNITKPLNSNPKMPLIITIKEPLISEKNNLKKLKNVLIRLSNSIKSKPSHMPGLLTVRKNLETTKRPNNIMKGHMNLQAILSIKNKKKPWKKRLNLKKKVSFPRFLVDLFYLYFSSNFYIQKFIIIKNI